MRKTQPIFLDELAEFVIEFLTENKNVVIIGDFNIHMDNEIDPDTQIFKDTMIALGLGQHVKSPSHSKGHILDLSFTETLSGLKVLDCSTDNFISDHAPVKVHLSIKTPTTINKEITVRKLNSTTTDDLLQTFNEQNISGTDTLEDLVRSFEKELSRVLDTLAPQETKRVQLRRLWI